MIIGERTAENIKMKIGCAYLREAELAIEVKGKHYITGMPRALRSDFNGCVFSDS